MESKRFVSLLLVMLMLCLSVAGAEDIADVAEETGNASGMITMRGRLPAEDLIGVQDETLTVGSLTRMTGHFATDLWGTNAADIDVRSLLHGYSTIAWLEAESAGLMFNGTALAAVKAEADAEGNRTYTFHLMQGLVYSDGTPITAKDYLFSLLLTASSEVAQLGGESRGLGHFVGYEAYLSGKAPAIRGIRLLSDTSFSLTVNGAFLPYFYGMAMLEITPYPMHVIAPGCDILDDGDGAYIGKGEGADAMSAAELGFAPGEFSAEMLAKTLMDPQTGYMFNPKVTSGPYLLESYDEAASTATFVINDKHRGNYEGQKPHIARIVFRYVENEEIVAALESGEIDLVNKVMNAAVLSELIERAVSGESDFTFSTYPRSGLAYLALACEEGVTADVAVRQAIARCLDKDTLIADLAAQNMLAVHGYYGIGQWMMAYEAEEDEEAGLAAISMPEEIEALRVPHDLEEAKALLEDAGWVYDAAGEAYAQGVRHRKEADGSLTPLIIRWAKPIETAHTTDAIRRYLEADFAQVGIGLEVTDIAFTDMMQHYNRIEPRTYDMFFLGNDFMDVFDPFYDFNVADEYQGMMNASGLRDEELMTLAWDMRSTLPSERQAFAHRWLAFQQRFVEVMPVIPLYSNVYFDFHGNRLQGYNAMRSTSWALSIPYAWIGEPEEAAMLEDDDMLFDDDSGSLVEID